MTERDAQIGAVISRLRGDVSQQAIADAMRRKGWKWSQATVWSIERGDRPLRVAEAMDLVHLLGVSMDQFVKTLMPEPDGAALVDYLLADSHLAKLEQERFDAQQELARLEGEAELARQAVADARHRYNQGRGQGEDLL